MNISHLLSRTRTCAYQGLRNVHFSENLTSFVFLKLETSVLRFALLSDDRWNVSHIFRECLKVSLYQNFADGDLFWIVLDKLIIINNCFIFDFVMKIAPMNLTQKVRKIEKARNKNDLNHIAAEFQSEDVSRITFEFHY